MGEGLVADDRSLLGRAFSLASRKSQTLESIAKALDVSPEDLSLCWIVLNKLRRCQGRALPAPFAVEQSAASTEAPMTQNWYAPTWLLSSLLETYQVNEGLAVH